VLVQEAAAGGRESYASLYDRYSTQVYNYCLRLTGSTEDAADATQDAFVNVLGRLQDDDRPVLDFASYLFAAARNESYALMRRRSRTPPSEEAPERAAPEPDLDTDPERDVLLRDSQDAVRQANATLAPRHREVLALRDVAGRSYGQIGQIMGVSENAAAQLIWRARGKLKVALGAGAVASVVASSEDCEHAQLLISALHDDEPITDAEREWLDEHLDECGSCKAARGMLFEVATSYRAWAPVAVLAGMKADTLASAGHVIGADWSSGVHGGGHLPGSSGSRAAAGGALAAAILAAIIALAGVFHDDVTVTRDAARADDDSASASKSKSSAKTKASKAATAAGLAAFGPSELVNTAAGEQQAVLGVSEESGGPGTVGAPAPLRGRHGTPPDTTPAPHHGQPRGDGPGTGSPGPTAPGDNPPGGGPSNPPGGGPPGGQPGDPPGGPGPNHPPKDPPGNPKDPPAPPEDKPPGTPPRGGSDCSWPGQGNGPGGCPPGHGGIPPGLGGTPPGQGKK